MNKQILCAGAVALALLLLPSCGSREVIEGTKPLEPIAESSVAPDYPAEFPPALEALPTDPPADPIGGAASSEAASVAPPPAASSSEAASSSQAAHPFETSSDGTIIVAPQQPGASEPSQSVPPQSSAPPPVSSTPDAADPDRYDELQAQAPVSTASVPDEVRAIWISYLDFHTLAQNKSKAEFSANLDRAFENISDYGLNTVFVQVRPFGDAMYPSDYFPWSYILTGTEGVDPGYDPLEIIVSKARSYDLRVEAWLNPYRVRAIGSGRALASSNPAVKAINAGRDTAISYQGGLFYNPASKAARDLITDGVVEIVENYDIDGIHFDDYFYPTTDMSFDAAYYSAYCKAGGTLSQANWRRQNVDLLVKQVYAAIKRADSSVLFGISPQARMDNNYNGQFIDVKKWIKTPGYLDYICPQIYFGFENQTVPYASSLAEWNGLTKNSHVQLYVGLAVYKCGTADQWAGAGKNEWIHSTDLLERMVTCSRDASAYGGFALYRYDSLFRPESGVKKTVESELANLAEIL